MATHTRDVAWRSLQSVFQALPADAIVDVVKVGQRPPAGVAMTVRVEITAPGGDGDKLDTWAAPPATTGPAGKPSPKSKAATGPTAKKTAGKAETATWGAGPAKDAAGGDDAK